MTCQSTLTVFLLSGAEPVLMSFITFYELSSVNCSAQSRDAVQVRVLCSLPGKGLFLPVLPAQRDFPPVPGAGATLRCSKTLEAAGLGVFSLHSREISLFYPQTRLPGLFFLSPRQFRSFGKCSLPSCARGSRALLARPRVPRSQLASGPSPTLCEWGHAGLVGSCHFTDGRRHRVGQLPRPEAGK